MTRTIPRYALRGTTKAALLCAAIAAALFVAAGGDLPEQTTGAAQLGPQGRERYAAMTRLNPSEAPAAVPAPTIAAPQMPESARTGALPIAPSPSAGAASYEHCPKLSRGRWLKWEIAQRRDRAKDYVIACDYGGLQIRAGDANL